MAIDGCRVLIVENELLLALTLATVAETYGGRVAGPVATVEGARCLLRAGEVDVALIDFYLVDHTTEPLALELASTGIPFAFVTGHSRELLPETVRGFPVLQKPCTMDEMSEVLHRLCRLSRAAGTGPGADEAQRDAAIVGTCPPDGDDPDR
jgi:DNA-binding NtrC family response regulator